jgi:hypothetical protein
MTIRRVNRGKAHQYWDGDRQLPGVTTIINGGLPKPALIPWAARVCGEYVVDHWDELVFLEPSKRLDAVRRAPDQARDTAAARGTDIHRLAEALIHGQEITIPDELIGPVEAYARFLDRWQVDARHVEATVVSRRWWYAGTLDLIAVLAVLLGRTWLLDIKTGKGVYDDVALQMAAYRYAEHILTEAGEQPMPEVDDVGVIHVLSDDVRLVPVEADRDTFRHFLHIYETYKWSRQVKDAPALGAALDPPAAPRLEVAQ